MRRRRASRVVVVVGASSGIGRATAHLLARRGDTVVLASRSAGALADVARECRAALPARGEARVVVVPVDVAVRESVERLFEVTRERVGRIDAVVHAPAVVAYGHFEEIPGEVFDQVMAVNLLGTANVARAALRYFKAADEAGRRRRGGHLVVIGSLLGRIATPWMSPYVVSKWAVHGLARTLQAEVRHVRGVDVSMVYPGGVDTPIYSQAANFAGRVGRPPPPVDRPETVARAIVRTLDRPRREVSVGLANRFEAFGFRYLPAVFDWLVGPIMSRAGLSRTPTEPTTGNVFGPLPAGDAVHGQWGRHWLRGVGVGAVGVVVAGSGRWGSGRWGSGRWGSERWGTRRGLPRRTGARQG
ncbi:SDR family oxidoreductase [Cellulomonas fimi]|uniref:SDR family NAD(P)-dependent oxidoreductase n=1 Tax=Cellulomonas fimi TaxID=1708 RepID=A0A7Y0QHA4_CELFI|nr:SDR family NAD(P)-dependent oxidoreductase [Cellulomonas fimi]NMR19983.1 SDR family NAD(P)-dependent oxidoreductase [Cellulomonas fimi]